MKPEVFFPVLFFVICISSQGFTADSADTDSAIEGPAFKRFYQVDEEDFESEEIRRFQAAEREYVAGRVLYDLGNLEEALRYFQRVLELDSSHAGAKDYRWRCHKLLEMKQKEESMPGQTSGGLLDGRQNTVSVTTESLRDLEQEGNVESARFKQRVLARCLRLAKDLYAGGEYRKALVEFQKILAMDPAHAQAVKYIKACKHAIESNT